MENKGNIFVAYMPLWLKNLFPEEGEISIISIYKVADSVYRGLSFMESDTFSIYIEDLIEEDVICRQGNFVHRGNNFSLATDEA